MNDMEKIEEKTVLISAAGIENRIYTVRGVQAHQERIQLLDIQRGVTICDTLRL